MIEVLLRVLSKTNDVVGIHDLADITKSPDRVYQILHSYHRGEFSPNQRIVFYSQYEPSNDLLKHLLDAALIIDIDPSFILICCSVNILPKIAETCKDHSLFQFLLIKLKSCRLENSFTLSSTLCPIPWTSLEVREDGTITPCCLCNNLSRIGNINDGIENSFRSQLMDKLRKDFINGGKPAGCNSCWNLEDRGLISNRLRHRSYLLTNVLINGLNKPEIKSLDLKFGKTCNFKCRICNSGSSSSYAEEEAKFKKIKFVLDKNWSTSPAHMTEVITLLPNLTNIDMYGGEPFLLKSFAEVLKVAVENGYAKSIRLHYNTNGSIYPKELIRYWPEFKEVDIQFSVDAIGARFNLERGGSWEAIEDNIIKIKNLNLTNIKMAVMPAISAMNVFYLDEVLDWASTHGFKINPHYVITPSDVSLTQLTREAKDMLIAKFKNYQWPEMQQILQHIQQIPDSDGAEFRKFIAHFDSLRNENFTNSHPEVAKAMGYMYNKQHV